MKAINIQFLATMVLALFAGGFWCFAVLEFRVFPHAQLSELRSVLRGSEGDERPLWTRLAGDVVFAHDKFRATNPRSLLPDEAFRPVYKAPSANGPFPLLDAIRIASLEPEADRRFFVVYGSFVFPDLRERIGAVAIDSEGAVYRAWPAGKRDGDFDGMHIGLSVSPDGMVATNANGILGAQSWCGDPGWQAERTVKAAADDIPQNAIEHPDWHHDITFHDGAFYSFVGQRVARVEAETGRVEIVLDLLDVKQWAWRDGLAILDTRMNVVPAGRVGSDLTDLMPPDPFHVNKVDVLDKKRAKAFPQFQEGDMALSLRELNLVLVVRPEEERILWWRKGLTSRQHDVTFSESGTIEVFNNAPFTLTPTLRSLDVERHTFEDYMALSAWNMRMRFKGNFERHGDRVLTVDDDAGRMIAGRTDGRLDVVLENRIAMKNGRHVGLQLRNATEIPAEQFAALEAKCNRLYSELQ